MKDNAHLLPPAIRLARHLATLMDDALVIPVLRKRIGLDAILGLLPVGGDALGAIVSGYIVLVAIQYRLPQRVIWTMLANIGLDFAIGAIPLLGDWFDAGWKANRRNVRLLEMHWVPEGRVSVVEEPYIDVDVDAPSAFSRYTRNPQSPSAGPWRTAPRAGGQTQKTPSKKPRIQIVDVRAETVATV
jgi:hypothetical protein